MADKQSLLAGVKLEHERLESEDYLIKRLRNWRNRMRRKQKGKQ
mgnify:FL=1